MIVKALQNKSTEFDSLSSDSSCPEIATAIENSNLVNFNSFEELLSYSNTGSTYSFTYTATETGYLFANMWCNSKSMTYTETVADGAKVSVSLETIDTSSWETAGTNKLYMIYMPKGSTTTIKCTHNNGSTMRIVASAGFASN
ncbi:MAG: hypothetical protein UHN47_03925 [Lachnospiraceae bacterium]|nr:hypothetical protein [Lachnospiraceae bacterium]